MVPIGDWSSDVCSSDLQQQTAQQSADSPKVEIRYVDRIKEIKVPVVQIRDRLVSACPGGVHHTGRADGGASAGARAAEPADGAAPADAGDGLLGAVADEIPKCVANGVQLDELQSLICANADQKLVKKLRRAGKREIGRAH